MTYADNHPGFARTNPQPDFELVKAADCTIARDNTELAESLRQSDTHHRAITEAAQDAIITVDKAGYIHFWNAAATRIFGFDANEAQARNILELLVPSADFKTPRDLIPQAGSQSQDGQTVELMARHRNGYEFPIELSISAFQDQGEYITVALIRDITQRKIVEQTLREGNAMMVESLEREKRVSAKLEATLEQLEEAKTAAEAATRSKSEFLANMSHEIRTPMTAILGFAENLLDPELSEAAKLNAARTIRRNGDHLLQIINDILDLSKIEMGKLEVECVAFSPLQILADVQGLMQVRADAKRLGLQVECEGAIPEIVYGDPTRLRQILVNLVGNAIKFTEMGGVRILARLCAASTPDPHLQFKVIDTGIGMSPEQIGRLFHAFTQADTSTTRKFGGTGLGLNISKRLAEMLGGGISVESALGRGSTFRVEIATGSLEGVRVIERPSIAEVAKSSTPTLHTTSPVKLDCNILLVEDGPDNQRLITTVLKKAGANVRVVDNGELALNAALQAHNGPQPFDIILMDMQMPVMDGYEATRRLRAENYTKPIIALTAHAMASDREKCLQVGCDDYATKPINRRELIQTIHGWLHTPMAAT
ncbi:MAG: response regulator [Planctomycetota bacterium]